MSGLDRLPLPVTVVVAQRALVDPAQPPWSARSSDQEPFPKTGHCPSWSRDRLPAWFGASHTAFPPGAESRTFQDAEKPQGGQEEQEKKITITLCIDLCLYFLLFLLSSLWFFCILPTRGMAGRCRPTPPAGRGPGRSPVFSPRGCEAGLDGPTNEVWGGPPLAWARPAAVRTGEASGTCFR